MANLVINTYCNLKCPYCFAEDEKQTYVNQEMTEENFKKAVNWITKTDDQVGIIGGEPTLHSNFRRYMMWLINNPKIELITLYTNGTHIGDYLDLLSNYKVELLVNLNSPEILGSIEKLNNIISDVDKLICMKKDNGIEANQITLGINLYKPGQDYSYFINALKRFDMHGCRMSVSIENIKDVDNYDPLEYFKKMKNTFVGFLNELIKIDCATREDCNFFPRCIFTDPELNRINNELYRINQKYAHTTYGICEESCINMIPPIDIHPDLRASKCFGCSEYDKQSILEYESVFDLIDYFTKSISNYSAIIPISNQCSNECKYYNMCYAGCMKYKLNKIDELKTIVNRM